MPSAIMTMKRKQECPLPFPGKKPRQTISALMCAGVLRGGFLHTTSERGEGYIAYKLPKEKMGLKTTLWGADLSGRPRHCKRHGDRVVSGRSEPEAPCASGPAPQMICTVCSGKSHGFYREMIATVLRSGYTL